MNITYAEESQWMPDPNLRQAVREALGIPIDKAFTPADMSQLTHLNAIERGIRDLTGLEHATNLEVLPIIRNEIRDISPLSNLINLVFLDLGGNQISDLRPLAGLTRLETLRLWGNQISDISALAGLVNLKELSINHNKITDISPLEGLIHLEVLRTHGNLLNCEIPRPSTRDRIRGRRYPSVFAAWHNIINRPHQDLSDLLTYHDLFFSGLHFGLQQRSTPEGVEIFGNLEGAQQHRQEMLSKNLNMLLLVSIYYYGAHPSTYPEDWPYWLRDDKGNRVQNGSWKEMLIDFTQPGAQDIFVNQAIAVAQCGVYDGIMLDWWQEDSVTLNNNAGVFHSTREAELQARVSMLRRIREGVGDDFLILVNTNTHKIPHSAPYVNGTFMETTSNGTGYTYEGLVEIEDTLLWAEHHLQFPQINCLEGWGVTNQPLDSNRNRQWMRVFTTLSLTHSDGYVSYVTGIVSPTHTHKYEIWKGHSNDHARGEPHDHTHQHYWYPFYDASLGRPTGGDETKGQNYINSAGETIDGVFIREFTNGWAVYNRSRKEQQIELPEKVSGVASGVKDKRSHMLPDLDGEIYLKTVVQVAPGKYPSLYWVDTKTDTLHSLVDKEVKHLVPGIQNVTSLAVDAAGEKLYWTEKTGKRTGKIQSVNLDGTNRQLVRNLTSAPSDIALDTTTGKLYLTNTWRKIQRMNLDGSNFQPNLITDLKTPQNLVLDTTDGKIYWTEQAGKTTGKVQRANLDGSNVRLVKKLTSAPRGMALDAVNRKLYLTNAWGKLQRINLDGSSFQPNFITGLEAPGQVVVDVIGGKFYWTEWGKLRRADLDGGNVEDVVTGLGELTDLVLGINAAGQIGVAAAPMTQTVVEQTSLLANYPNPFNPETWIPYQLATDTDVEIRIYDTRGSLVRSLALGHQRAGIYTGKGRVAYWDGRNDVGERVASGVYFYQLKTDNVSFLRKMVILK